MWLKFIRSLLNIKSGGTKGQDWLINRYSVSYACANEELKKSSTKAF